MSDIYTQCSQCHYEYELTSERHYDDCPTLATPPSSLERLIPDPSSGVMLTILHTEKGFEIGRLRRWCEQFKTIGKGDTLEAAVDAALATLQPGDNG